MRTVGPELWYKRLKKPPIVVTRRMNFGQKRSNTWEICFRKSFVDAIMELYNNCSVIGFKYIRVMNTEKFMRRILFISTLLIILIGIVLLAYNIHGILKSPPVTVTLQSTNNSIDDVAFPAIALCSYNVISKQSIKKYAETLIKYPGHSYNESFIESQLLAFGALLTISLPPINSSFLQFLARIKPSINVTDLMFNLDVWRPYALSLKIRGAGLNIPTHFLQFSTPCSSMLLRCSWRGNVTPCEDLFGTRVTPLGFCCVFNSRYQPEDQDRSPKYLDMVGQDFGLGIVLKEDQEDYAYVRRDVDGVEMLVFDGSQYPLLEVGSVRMYPMTRNSSLYLSLTVRAQQASKDALQYSEDRNLDIKKFIRQRGCRAKSPAWKGLSWCLANCRRNTVGALCGCVPFTLVSSSDHHPVSKICGLSDLGCLNKHKEKFMYLKPWDSSHPQLSEELQDGLDCPECLFDCDRLDYSAQISYSDYVWKKPLFHNYLSANIQLTNASVIRVSYNTEDQHKYAVEANLPSYELIARSCCIWIFATGLSAVGAAELVFHVTVRWLHHFLRRYNIFRLRFNDSDRS